MSDANPPDPVDTALNERMTEEHVRAAGARHSDPANEVHRGSAAHGHSEWPLRPADVARIAFVALAAAAVRLGVWEPLATVSVIGLLGLAVGIWPVVREAGENLRERRMTMELSMALAVVAAIIISEFFTALVITLFVLIAEALERLTVWRGRRSLADLLDFLPRYASVRRADGRIEEVGIDALQPGDLVLVRPGGRIPVDGPVVEGHSFVEEAAITGEALPAEKLAGSEVFAGTINQSGALEIRAVRLGRDSTFGRIVEAVERAERSRAPVQKTADRLAAYLVYFALAAAALTFLRTGDLRSTIAVVIVAGACGVAAGTPLAILGGIARTTRLGVIVKGGVHLESLARVDELVLDKTGTVTFGAARVSAVHPAGGATEADVLRAAAIAEGRSEHPLGRAIVERAGPLVPARVQPTAFRYRPGRGVVAVVEGDEVVAGNRALLEESGVDLSGLGSPAASLATEVLVARGGRFLGSIEVADAVRPEAAAAVAAARQLGIRTRLLSGDRQEVTAALGASLGTDAAEGGLLPEDKLRRVEALVASGRNVAMIGDGMNDAPALAAAAVGIAMGSGTDLTRESADVLLIGDDLSSFVETLRIARRTRRTIRQNFAGTIAVDVVGVGLAAAGLLSPVLAAFIHVTSEMLFILNSARLLPLGSAGDGLRAPFHPSAVFSAPSGAHAAAEGAT